MRIGREKKVAEECERQFFVSVYINFIKNETTKLASVYSWRNTLLFVTEQQFFGVGNGHSLFFFVLGNEDESWGTLLSSWIEIKWQEASGRHIPNGEMQSNIRTHRIRFSWEEAKKNVEKNTKHTLNENQKNSWLWNESTSIFCDLKTMQKEKRFM